MMTKDELRDLRRRFLSARANRQSVGAADAYVAKLEAHVSLKNFNGRRASVQHLLALVDAAIQEHGSEKTSEKPPAEPQVESTKPPQSPRRSRRTRAMRSAIGSE